MNEETILERVKMLVLAYQSRRERFIESSIGALHLSV